MKDRTRVLLVETVGVSLRYAVIRYTVPDGAPIALRPVQKLVGGYVECVYTHSRIPGVSLLVNEDGLSLRLAPSPLGGLVGPVAIVGVSRGGAGEDWIGLTAAQEQAQLALLGLDPKRVLDGGALPSEGPRAA